MYVWMCGCVDVCIYVCVCVYDTVPASAAFQLPQPNPIQPSQQKNKEKPRGGGACIDMYVDTYVHDCVRGRLWQGAVFFFFFLFFLSTRIVYNEDLQPCGEPELKQTSSFYFRRTAKARKRLAWAV